MGGGVNKWIRGYENEAVKENHDYVNFQDWK